MSNQPRCSLMDVHNALSHLTFAVKQCFSDISVDVSIEYDDYVYISVKIGCYEHDQQKVIDRLSHGIFHGDYDYRFRVSYTPIVKDAVSMPFARGFVYGYPDMGHDMKVVAKKQENPWMKKQNIKVGSKVTFNTMDDATWFDVVAIDGFNLTVKEEGEVNGQPYATQHADKSLVKQVK